MQAKKAFSFVEIIIVVSIIALLAVVGMSYQGAQNQNTKNTKTIGDLGTLNNSLLSYMEVEKTLPLPKGNKNYFTKIAEYSHDEIGAYGVHGFVTQDLLPNKYLNYLPLDPRTNQYYAYGKTLDNKFYEIAGVLKEDGEYVSKVQGNYPADNGPYSLIREYNGADFVSDNSKVSFPYNPEERVLVAKINHFSGTVKINGSTENIITHTLVQGDTIEVPVNGTATIFFSDGSQSVLGDTSGNSVLKLDNMEFKQNDNLTTRIKLFLESGALWTKATRLNQEDGGSDFEVYTDDTTAAVRGTIFGIRDNGANTSVRVTEGEVNIHTTVNSEKGTFIKKATASDGYNSPITQPDFTIVTKLPNNTITGAVLQNSDLAAEYADKNTEEQITFLSGATAPTCNGIEVGTDCYELYASAEYNDTDNMNKDNINSKFLLLKTTNGDISASSYFPSWDWSGQYASYYPGDIQGDDISGYPFTDVTGVYINNVGNDDFIKYENLDLGEKFIIEINVFLPSDYKQNTTPHYLLNGVKNGNDVFELYIQEEKLNNHSTINADYFDNKFHTFSVDNNGKIKIDGNYIGTIAMNTDFDTLYVGTNYNSIYGNTGQWNNIINYLKIYKN